MAPGNHYFREVVPTGVAAGFGLACTGAALFLPGRWYLLAWLPFAAGAWLVLRLPRRTALVLILLGAAVLPLIAARQPPTSSDDVYRYLWDGLISKGIGLAF